MTATQIERAQVCIEKALALLDAGFNAKARQKEATNHLNHAYSALSDFLRDIVITRYSPADDSDESWQGYVDRLDEYDLPFDLHHVRERHIAKARELNKDVAQSIAFLVETRAAVKAEPIQKGQPKAVPSEYQVRAEKSLAELIEKRKAQYLEAVDLGRVFEGLPVSANTHGVIHQSGTHFLRTYYYLNGRLTPLSVIIAAAEALSREARGA